MKLGVYSIFDAAVGAYNQPFFAQTDSAAVRLFSDQCNNKESLLSRNPEHFTLFRIGEFDDKEGELTDEVPNSLGNGVQFYQPPESFSVEDVHRIMSEIRSHINK